MLFYNFSSVTHQKKQQQKLNFDYQVGNLSFFLISFVWVCVMSLCECVMSLFECVSRDVEQVTFEGVAWGLYF